MSVRGYIHDDAGTSWRGMALHGKDTLLLAKGVLFATVHGSGDRPAVESNLWHPQWDDSVKAHWCPLFTLLQRWWPLLHCPHIFCFSKGVTKRYLWPPMILRAELSGLGKSPCRVLLQSLQNCWMSSLAFCWTSHQCLFPHRPLGTPSWFGWRRGEKWCWCEKHCGCSAPKVLPVSCSVC